MYNEIDFEETYNKSACNAVNTNEALIRCIIKPQTENYVAIVYIIFLVFGLLLTIKSLKNIIKQ